MNDSIQDRVYALVAKERGMRREKLRAITTLSRDLGMEGYDAVEFFEKFEKEFSVDLKPLGADWHCYFASESVTLSAGLLVAIPGFIISIGLIKLFPNLPEWFAFIVGFSAWVIAVVFWSHWRSKKDPQITIQDLIGCAESGIWTKQVPAGAENKVNVGSYCL